MAREWMLGVPYDNIGLTPDILRKTNIPIVLFLETTTPGVPPSMIVSIHVWKKVFMNKVFLTHLELKIAAMVGQSRIEDSIKKRLPQTTGVERSLDIDTLGAECELAVAKFLNRYPVFSVSTFKAPDVDGLQVRGTTVSTGRLIMRPNDPVDNVYVLVVKYPFSEYIIAGWITGRRAQKIGIWEEKVDRPGAWWVSQSNLNPLDWLDPYMQGSLRQRPRYIQ
jgi:hypothetical protein